MLQMWSEKSIMMRQMGNTERILMRQMGSTERILMRQMGSTERILLRQMRSKQRILLRQMRSKQRILLRQMRSKQRILLRQMRRRERILMGQVQVKSLPSQSTIIHLVSLHRHMVVDEVGIYSKKGTADTSETKWMLGPGVQDDPARHHLPCPYQHSQHHPDQLPQGEQQQEKIRGVHLRKPTNSLSKIAYKRVEPNLVI
jgi:hypothetical protein